MKSNTDLVSIPVPGSSLPLYTDGKRLAALKPIADYFGVNWAGQLTKLKGKSWATIEKFSTVGADGKVREMTGGDRRTLTMWLATLDENRVAEDKREELRAYQSEAAEVLDSYFHEGGAINPRATEDQRSILIAQARGQAEVINALRGIVDHNHLEAQGRIVLAAALGQTPALDPSTTPLYVSDYLRDQGLSSTLSTAKASGFGKRLKGLYIAEHGDEPGKAYQQLPNGTTREVCAYIESDRPLFDRVWTDHYASVVA